MRRTRHYFASAIVTILLASAIPTTGTSGASADAYPDAPAYAKLHSTTISQARLEMKLEDDAAALQARLVDSIPESFGGMWIEHKPAFGVVVALKDGQGGEVVARHAPPTLTPILATRSVRLSERELESLAEDVKATAAVPVNISIDVPTNRVRVMTTDKAMLSTQSFSAVVESHPELSVELVASLGGPTADIYGGLAISACTSGFSVRSSTATTTGILTAGHCSNTQTFQGVNLPAAQAGTTGNYDAQWHTTPGFTDRPKFRWHHDGATRNVTSVSTHSQYVTGGTLCKFGNTTGYACGELVSKSFCPSWVSACSAAFLQLKNCSVDMSTGGDSGGPVFVSYRASGIVSGYYHDIFCATDYMIATRIPYAQSGVDVLVLIAP